MFPGGLPTTPESSSSETLATMGGGVGHAAVHESLRLDVLAACTKIGTGASTPTANTVLRGTGTGTSAWGQVDLETDVTNRLPLANGGAEEFRTGTGETLVRSTAPALVGGSWVSPTLLTPTIASFTNAQHNHSNASGGGQIGASGLVHGRVRRRQGGTSGSNDWSSPGTTDSDMSGTDIFEQVGAATSSAGGIVTVTFPVAYEQVPLVVGTILDNTTFGTFQVQTISKTGFVFSIFDANGSRFAATAMWRAVGQ